LNNLFQYSTKELTTDAFLSWLFTAFNQELEDWGAIFFHRLGLKVLATDDVSKVSVRLQEQHTDLIVGLEVNGEAASYLFENKTYSSIHSDQLVRYKDAFSSCTGYLYLKLGVINYQERIRAEEDGYTVIGAKTLHQALLPLRNAHFLIAHYLDFLENEYIAQQDHIATTMITDNCFRVLNYSGKNKGQEQQAILSALHKSLATDYQFEYLRFRSQANNNGYPWVQLTITKRGNAYKNVGESLFWRIDRRSKKTYLRLTQYAKVGAASKAAKHKNRDLLRQQVQSLPALQPLTQGKIQNGGTFASEIVIFFFEDNSLNKLMKALPELSDQVAKLYTSNQSWIE